MCEGLGFEGFEGLGASGFGEGFGADGSDPPYEGFDVAWEEACCLPEPPAPSPDPAAGD